MCDCRKEIEADKDGAVAAHISKKYKGAPVVKIDFDETAFPFARDSNGAVKMRCVTYSNIKVTAEERKRPVSVTILHSFCPFCGVKYE